MSDPFKTIEIRDLSVSYPNTVVFEHFDLTLPSRGCVCFFGPSGSGKTTLLQVLAGLKKPSAGSIRVCRDTGEADAAEADTVLPATGYVFQENRLIPWLTALENVAFVMPGKTRHGPGKKNAMPDLLETARKWLEEVGLGEAMDKYPSQLSGGMNQRVNIARALAFDAPVILLDEPFKGLDDAIKEKIMGIFGEMKKDRLILFVTHDKEDVRQLADRIIPIRPIR